MLSALPFSFSIPAGKSTGDEVEYTVNNVQASTTKLGVSSVNSIGESVISWISTTIDPTKLATLTVATGQTVVLDGTKQFHRYKSIEVQAGGILDITISETAAFNLGTSGDIVLSSQTFIKVAGILKGKAFTLDCQDVVVEEAGLITSEGTSLLFGPLQLREKYDAFLVDVATVHETTSATYIEVRTLMAKLKMRHKTEAASAKQTSANLKLISLLDAKFPVAFDALFLTNSPVDDMIIKPCIEIFQKEKRKEMEHSFENGYYTISGSKHNPTLLSPFATKDCWLCIAANHPIKRTDAGHWPSYPSTLFPNSWREAGYVTGNWIQKEAVEKFSCKTLCGGANGQWYDIVADFDKTTPALIKAGVHGGFPGKTPENPDNHCYGKTYGDPLAPIDIGTSGHDSKFNGATKKTQTGGGGAIKIVASNSVTVKQGGRISSDGFPTASYTAGGTRDWSIWEADQSSAGRTARLGVNGTFLYLLIFLLTTFSNNFF